MITSYPITTTFFSPVLGNGLPTPLTLSNLSTSVTITVNDSSNGAGFPLGPGASVSWDAGKPLYALSSAPATLVVLDNGGTISNPATLAQLIVDSGLAQGIADKLAASSLATNIGTQTSSKVAVAGAPPRDIMTTLYDNTFSNIGPGVASSSMIDVSAYQSYYVKVDETLPAPIAVPVPRLVTIRWYSGSNPNSATLICRDSFYVNDNTGGSVLDSDFFTTFQGPVRGPFMRIDISPTSNNPSTVYVNVIGSFKAIPDTEYRCRSSYFGVGGTGTFWGNADDNAAGNVIGNKTAGTLQTSFPPVKSGVATFTAWMSSVTTAGSIVLSDAILGSGQGIIAAVYMPVLATGQFYSQQIVIPNRPLRVTADSGMVGTGYRWSLTYSAS